MLFLHAFRVQIQFYFVCKSLFIIDLRTVLFNLFNVPCMRIVHMKCAMRNESLYHRSLRTTTRTWNWIFQANKSVQEWKHLPSSCVHSERDESAILKMSKWRQIMVVMRTSLTDYYRRDSFTMFCSKYTIRSSIRRKMWEMCVSVIYCFLPFNGSHFKQLQPVKSM